MGCYEVLRHERDPRASQLLANAQQIIQTRAAKLDDAWRRTYLKEMALHKMISNTKN